MPQFAEHKWAVRKAQLVLVYYFLGNKKLEIVFRQDRGLEMGGAKSLFNLCNIINS